MYSNECDVNNVCQMRMVKILVDIVWNAPQCVETKGKIWLPKPLFRCNYF